MNRHIRQLPDPVPPGARVGVMALAGTPDPDKLSLGIACLERAGFEVVPAPNLTTRTGYTAGDDEERLAGLAALLDARVDVLLAARGGYGVTRLLPRLPWEELARWRGWIVGFSDITALHAGAATRLPYATLLGPMGTTLSRDAGSTEALFAWLKGGTPQPLLSFRPEQVVRPGRASGVSIGGNLSILAALLATPFEPPFDGAVLFLEDVGEYTYRLDRLLTQLRLSSRLSRVNAVVAGRLVECGRGDAAWPERWRELLAEAAPGAVVVDGAGFGHGIEHAPIPLGVEVTVDTARGEVNLGGP